MNKRDASILKKGMEYSEIMTLQKIMNFFSKREAIEIINDVNDRCYHHTDITIALLYDNDIDIKSTILTMFNSLKDDDKKKVIKSMEGWRI